MNEYLVECAISGLYGTINISATSPFNAVMIYMSKAVKVSGSFNIKASDSSNCNVRVTKINGIRKTKSFYIVSLK